MNFISPRITVNECKRTLSGQTYKSVPFLNDVKIIFDVGANIGASSIFFANMYKDTIIHSFEPSRAALDLLEKNTEKFDSIQIHDFGLFNNDVEIDIYIGTHSSLNNSLCRHKYSSPKTEKIKLKSAKDFLLTNNIDHIDILKVDTEGCEIHILDSLKDCLSNIKAIYMEFHSESDRLAIDEMLKDNFSLVHGVILNPHRGNFCYVSKVELAKVNLYDGIEININNI